MASNNFYLAKMYDEYQAKWDAIPDKSAWIRKHMDTDTLEEMGQSTGGHIRADQPNVPRPVDVNVYRWNQHLKDHGFNVGELPNE